MSRAQKIFIAFALIFCASLAANYSKIAWRLGDVVDKITINPPRLTWADVIYGLTVSPGHPIVRTFSEGPVTIQSSGGDGPCPVLWNTPWGEMWARFEDEEILEFLAREQFDLDIYEFGPVKLREGDVVIDVGAHLGTFARAVLQRGAGHVIAIEPEPTNIECLKKNLKQEIEQGRVTLVEAAAWESSGTLKFELEHSFNSAMGRVESGGTVEVKALTIDEIVQNLGVESVDFIKMDIEGSERHALKGARETLASKRPRLALCVYHLPDDPEAVAKAVLEAQPDYQFAGRHGGQAFYF